MEGSSTPKFASTCFPTQFLSALSMRSNFKILVHSISSLKRSSFSFGRPQYIFFICSICFRFSSSVRYSEIFNFFDFSFSSSISRRRFFECSETSTPSFDFLDTSLAFSSSSFFASSSSFFRFSSSSRFWRSMVSLNQINRWIFSLSFSSSSFFFFSWSLFSSSFLFSSSTLSSSCSLFLSSQSSIRSLSLILRLSSSSLAKALGSFFLFLLRSCSLNFSSFSTSSLRNFSLSQD